jgi:hypothetical protein
MASTEQDIVDALVAMGDFAKVRYMVADSDPDTAPTLMPLAVLTDDGKDFSAFATMCGGGEVALESWVLNIYVSTESGAVGLRDLTSRVVLALAGIAMVDETTSTYDSELRAYTTELLLS